MNKGFVEILKTSRYSGETCLKNYVYTKIIILTSLGVLDEK